MGQGEIKFGLTKAGTSSSSKSFTVVGSKAVAGQIGQGEIKFGLIKKTSSKIAKKSF